VRPALCLYTTNALRLTVSTLNRQVASDLSEVLYVDLYMYTQEQRGIIIDQLPATCCKAARNCRVDACGCT